MASLDIDIYQGSTFEWLILVKDINGIPLDMTLYTGGTAGSRGMVRKNYSDVVATLTFDISILNNTGVLAAIAAGSLRLTTQAIADLEDDTVGKCYLLVRAEASATEALDVPSCVYDIEIEDITGYVFKPYFGSVNVYLEATKA